MLYWLIKKWVKLNKVYELHKEALLADFAQVSPILKIRNLKGLIEAHNKDIQLNGGEIAELELEIKHRREMTAEGLFNEFFEAENDEIPENYKPYLTKMLDDHGNEEWSVGEDGEKAFIDFLVQQNNNLIAKHQSDIANFKKLTEQFQKDVEGFELEIKGRKGGLGQEITGLNTQQMGYKVKAERLRMEAQEIFKIF